MTSLIISANQENILFIDAILKTKGLTVTAQSGNEARRIISGETGLDLIIIDTPLPDEFGLEIAKKSAETTTADVILMCLNDISDDIAHGLPENIKIITKPLSREEFRNVAENFSGVNDIKKENSGILTKIDEIRLINRAKCTLMNYLDFTEPQAHRYIEKQAMNNRQTRREVAEKIICTYKK